MHLLFLLLKCTVIYLGSYICTVAYVCVNSIIRVVIHIHIISYVHIVTMQREQRSGQKNLLLVDVLPGSGPHSPS